MNNLITYLNNRPHNWIFVAIILLFVIVWVVNLFVCLRNKSHYKNVINAPLLNLAIKRLNAWLTAATFWMIVEYIFVIIPFVANVIVVYISSDSLMSQKEILFYSIVSLSFIVLGYAVMPTRHKQGYRKAYSVLDASINKYIQQTNENTDLKALQENMISAIEEGETYIDDSYDV